MAEEKVVEDVATEDKIAQSTGNETEQFSQELEDDADQIIKDMYPDNYPDEDKEKKDVKKVEDKDTGDDDKDDLEDDDKDGEEDGEDDDEEGNESVQDLLDKLGTSEKRVKDTRKEFTKKSQELSEYKQKTIDLEETVFTLKTKMEELVNSQQTKSEEKKTEKEIKKEASNLTDQMKEIEAVDPDLAKAMAPIVDGMLGQIKGLQTQLKTSEEKQVEREEKAENDKAEAEANAHFKKLDDAHEGWEAMMKTKEFEKYLRALPPRLKRLAILDLKDGKAEDIIEIFNDFKGDEEEDDKGEKKLDKANKMAGPKVRKSKEINRGVKKMKYTRSEIAAMEPLEYAEQEADIDKAMQDGLIDNR